MLRPPPARLRLAAEIAATNFATRSAEPRTLSVLGKTRRKTMGQRFASKWLGGSIAFCALALAGHAHAQQLVTQLHAPEATKWRWLGTSLAIDANTFVSGAPESLRNADTSNCSTALPGYGAI